MIEKIVDRTRVNFNEVICGPKFFVCSFVDGKAVGVYRLNMEDRNIVTGDLDVLDKGKGYARPLIEYVISLLSSKPVVHCGDLTTEEAREITTHIQRTRVRRNRGRFFKKRLFKKWSQQQSIAFLFLARMKSIHHQKYKQFQ